MNDESRSFFSKIGFILLVYSFLHNATGIFIPLAVQKLIPGLEEMKTLYYLVNLLPTYLIAFPSVYILFKNCVDEHEFPKHKMKFGHWILTFIIVYGVGITINIFTAIINMIIQMVYPEFMNSNALTELMLDMNPFLTILIVGIIAPIVEELVFRKLLIDRLIPYGEVISILLSGIIFGIFHGNLQQCFFAAALGVFFGFIYVKTRKIHYTIFLHMAVNLYSCMYMILLQIMQGSGLLEESEAVLETTDPEVMIAMLTQVLIPLLIMLGMMFVSFALAITGIVLFCVFFKRFRISKESLIPIEKGMRFKTIILNPGMICLGIFWIVVFVKNTFFG